MSALREHFQAVLAAGGPTSPATLADAVAKKVQTADLKAALDEALPYMARAVIAETRPSTPAPATTSKSWKRDAIRRQEKVRRSELDALYAVGDGTFKRLGAFDYDQLVRLADAIQSLAEAHAARSAHIRAIADAVKAAGVDTADDLDQAVLSDLGVAA